MRFDAIGTKWSIETKIDLAGHVKKQIYDYIEEFDSTYSRFRDDSLVAQLKQAAGEYRFPDNATPLVDFYKKLYDVTDGMVTPLVGDSLENLGYDKRYSFTSKGVRSPDGWDDVMAWCGTTVVVSRPVSLDFGAAGKGYLVDRIATILENYGHKEYVIDASGDVRHRGPKAEIVGLEDPSDPTKVIGMIPLQNTSLCASATNRRRWGDNLHHIVDGKTGAPANDVVAVWAVADSTMIADGLATALFFVDSDRLTSFASFQFVRIFANGRVEHSPDFVGELFV